MKQEAQSAFLGDRTVVSFVVSSVDRVAQMFELLALALAITALWKTRAGAKQLQDLARRLERTEATIAGLARRSENEAASPEAPPESVAGTPTPEAIPDKLQAPAAAEPQPPSSVPPIALPPPAQSPGWRSHRPSAAEPGWSIEQELGARWPVWIGGLALALGGIFLVRFALDEGWFGPAARVALGALLAATLLAASEWFRRAERRALIAALPEADIPAVLTAAGTATAFGTAYAAHALYGFIGPAAAFVLLGAIGIATMLAAALHGPALAGLGLAGSFLTPLLVSSQSPRPWPLVIYLAVVSAAALLLARLRQWKWLASLVVAGIFGWGIVIALHGHPGDLDWAYASLVHVLVQLALVSLLVAIEPSLGTDDAAAIPEPYSVLTLAVVTALALVAIMSLDAKPYGWVALAALMAGVLSLTAYVAAPAAAASAYAGSLVLALALSWPGLRDPEVLSRNLWPAVAAVLPVPEAIENYLVVAIGLALAVAAVAALRLWRGPSLPLATTAIYAAAATLAPLLVITIAYLRVTQFDHSIRFAGMGLVLSLFFASLSASFQRRESSEILAHRMTTGAFAAASLAAFSFALVTSLDRGYLTVALALSALGTAFVAVRLDVRPLRHAVSVLALVVLARVIWDPRIMGADVGRFPIVNWLLLGYGVPAVSFWASARLLLSEGPVRAGRIADAAALLFAALLGFYEIHHWLNAGDITVLRSTHVEQGLFALLAIGFAYVLLRSDMADANPVYRYASHVFAAVSAVVIVLGLGISHNPYLRMERIAGPPVLSSLALAYLLPALAAGWLAHASRTAQPARPHQYVLAASALAILLLVGYVTLELRHMFQGEIVHWARTTSGAEQWSYSAAWLSLGVLFLAFGIWRNDLSPRLASAALVMLAIVKVFFFDLSELTGFWRALSFIVLGAVLIGIGLVYQNLLRRNAGSPVGGAT